MKTRNVVSIVDTRDHTVIKTIDLPAQLKPKGVVVSPDGRKLYTANGLSNDVTVVDTVTNKVVATIKAGDGLWGIAL